MLLSCESSSLSSRSFKIDCRSSGEYADAGYTLNISRTGAKNFQLILSTTTFAGETNLYNGRVNVLSTNNNSDTALIESMNKSLLIETKTSNALVMKIDNQNITDTFANLSCDDSLAKYL